MIKLFVEVLAAQGGIDIIPLLIPCAAYIKIMEDKTKFIIIVSVIAIMFLTMLFMLVLNENEIMKLKVQVKKNNYLIQDFIRQLNLDVNQKEIIDRSQL